MKFLCKSCLIIAALIGSSTIATAADYEALRNHQVMAKDVVGFEKSENIIKGEIVLINIEAVLEFIKNTDKPSFWLVRLQDMKEEEQIKSLYGLGNKEEIFSAFRNPIELKGRTLDFTPYMDEGIFNALCGLTEKTKGISLETIDNLTVEDCKEMRKKLTEKQKYYARLSQQEEEERGQLVTGIDLRSPPVK